MHKMRCIQRIRRTAAKRKPAIIFIWFIFIMVVPAFCTHVQTVTEGGGPYPNVLVIIQSLDGYGELGRYLSDLRGNIPDITFRSDLYRIITTCPYGGACDTTVREMFGDQVGPSLKLFVPEKPIYRSDSSERAHPTTSQPRLSLVFQSLSKKSLSEVRIITRGKEACGSSELYQKEYSTDIDGRVDLQVFKSFSEHPWFAVVVYQHRVITYELSLRCPDREFMDPSASQCIEYHDNELTHVVLPVP